MSCARIFGLLSLTVLIAVGGPVVAGQLTANNLVVVQIGDGAAIDNLVTVPVVLQERSTTGTLVQTINMPTATSGSTHALTLNRNRAGGQLMLSVDGHYLTVGGTDRAPRDSNPASPARTVGRVDAAGTVDTSTVFSDAFATAGEIGIRSVASLDGSAFWLAGKGGGNQGIRYIPFGGTTTTSITDPTAASRDVAIFGGQLYHGADTGLFQVGSGVPTTGIQAQTLLAGLPTTAIDSPVFFDLDPNIAGLDTVYFGEEDAPGVFKFTFNGTTWSQAAVYGTSSILFLTGHIEDNKVTLYGSTNGSGSGAFANSLVKLVDEGVGSTLSTLATAPANYSFRGVAFTPIAVPEPGSCLLMLIGVGVMGVGRSWNKQGSRGTTCATTSAESR
jgi:hypothetical protein